MTIKELQDDINVRLQQFDGRKYTGAGSIPEYHKWYEGAIAEELEKNGIEIFHPITWRIVAEIDGPGEVHIHDAEVAKIELDTKKDRRYKYGGPGTINSIRVYFREELQGMSIEEARVFLLKAELDSRLEYYKKERERIAVTLDEIAGKIAELTALEVV